MVYHVLDKMEGSIFEAGEDMLNKKNYGSTPPTANFVTHMKDTNSEKLNKKN